VTVDVRNLTLTLTLTGSDISCNTRLTAKHEFLLTLEVVQDAQLSQRDRAAGCVIVFAKSRRLELGDSILETLWVYLQPL